MSLHLVISPECTFQSLHDLLSQAEWEMVASAARPILPGEPEHATFERGASRMHYTFNPVCLLRVLESTDDLDSTTRMLLPVAGVNVVESWLGSTEERVLLRGVLAARIVAEPRLNGRLLELAKHPRAVIAHAAAQASEPRKERGLEGPGTGTESSSGGKLSARDQALEIADILRAQVEPLLRALSHDRTGEVLKAVRPRPDDWAKAFVAAAAEAARLGYATIWERIDPSKFLGHYPDGAQTNLICDLAPAGMLGHENELSRRFPGGYRSISHMLDPKRVWVRWKFTRPGEAVGLASDGLVWLDDHWAWFPKPYRVLGRPQAAGDAAQPG